MTVRVNKDSFNIREKLSELERPIGLKGSELMRAETAQEARELVGAGRKNLSINGAMMVAQRGVEDSGSGYKSVDRINMAVSTADVRSSQGSLTSGKLYDKGFRNFVRMTNTTASTASNCYREIDYKMEARDLANSGWVINSGSSDATFSAWVRSAVTQKFFIYIRSIGGTTKSYTFGFETIANTWVKIEHTIPGDSTLGVNNDNSLGMLFRFVVDYGPDYTGTSCTEEVWRVTGSDYTPDSDGTWAATAGATFDITGLQLEVGKNATDFEHRSYGEELALCQRYFQKIGKEGHGGLGKNDYIASGFIDANGSAFYGGANLKVTMRTSPSISISGTASHLGYTQPAVAILATGINNYWSNPQSYVINLGGTGSGTTGFGGYARITNDATQLEFNAEL